MQFVILCATFLLAGVVSTATAEKAEWLLRYQKKTKKFELNHGVLPKIAALKPPITVISAIGDARVGKSTTLNFVRHILENEKNGETNIEEVFATGDTTRAVTEGLWISIYEQRDGKAFILLDVEGVNLGNDIVTHHLSVFTALLSSGIGLFCSGNINNHMLDFLYKLPRLRAEVFEKSDIKDSPGQFGHLHAVFRAPLDPPEGQTLEGFVKLAIFFPDGEDEENDRKRKVIAEYFDQRDFFVTSVPEIPGGKLFKNTSRAKNDNLYWKSMKSIADRFENFPIKTTLRKVHMDGSAVSHLLRALVDRINKNSWMEFGDSYLQAETAICDRRYEEIIAPVLREPSASQVCAAHHNVLTKFSARCPLENFHERAEAELLKHAEKLQEEEEKRRQERAEHAEKLQEEEKRQERERWWVIIAVAVSLGLGSLFALCVAFRRGSTEPKAQQQHSAQTDPGQRNEGAHGPDNTGSGKALPVGGGHEAGPLQAREEHRAAMLGLLVQHMIRGVNFNLEYSAGQWSMQLSFRGQTVGFRPWPPRG